MLGNDAIWACGTMSGTSLDGVDAALVLTNGEEISGFGEVAFRAYSADEREMLRAELGAWEASEALCEMLETAHVQAIHGLTGYELIGFHGQTLAHEPHGRGTYQAGDGAVLAEVLNRPVVWDFRTSDVKLGGEGAPLAPFFHHACARYIGAQEPVAFLNLGGVGNITWVDPRLRNPAAPGALLAFDTGPANAPVNDLMRQRRAQTQDDGGRLAASGRVAEGVLEAFLEHPYFYRMPPKSLDRNDFTSLLDGVADLSDVDAAATLTAACAASVARGMDHCPVAPATVFVTGGGRHNATLMAMLAAGLDCPVRPVEDVDLDGDMLEAQAFAYLAVRVARGLPTSCPATTGVRACVGGGRIARPTPRSADVHLA
ncbi:Anhydro-N-acetylmuramic acid kinase [Aquimixticola soesokkakensis]|uniref:Anhydro-N-acetylmuramic acid kinase n=1 Tax=Aquimixticola soesokkakensis TaxID=1519096 RepID=A0A1Y5SRE1_9RHOB|nr:anhydro-N-acetylmuramic acid kinase [Aquimixticola soesokkakensis]SLN46229.1 Anhydro-N-acetylmuramic acid kinase [Aquimixticola soesokkakensis]